MIFNRAERSGAIILVLALIGIIVIPRQVLPKSHNIFLLTAPVEVEQDSIATSTQPRTPAYKKRYAKTSNPVELNSADSMALIAIRGIGPYYSSRIFGYHELQIHPAAPLFRIRRRANDFQCQTAIRFNFLFDFGKRKHPPRLQAQKDKALFQIAQGCHRPKKEQAVFVLPSAFTIFAGH